MARPLSVQHHRLTTTSEVGLAAASLVLCALSLFMCATHSHKWRRRWRATCYSYEDPVIQVLDNEGMMTSHDGFHQLENGDGGSNYSGEVSVWKKNIMMGGKCQLPDFSGVIMYDSAGNIVPPAKAPLALPWK